ERHSLVLSLNNITRFQNALKEGLKSRSPSSSHFTAASSVRDKMIDLLHLFDLGTASIWPQRVFPSLKEKRHSDRPERRLFCFHKRVQACDSIANHNGDTPHHPCEGRQSVSYSLNQ